MAWDLGFTARLGQAAEPVFLLEHVKLPEGVRGSIKACSHAGFGAPEIIARPGPSVQGTSIRLREWKPTIGGFSVPIAAAGGRWLRQLKRGQIYELKVGFRGVSRFDFQTVAIGQVWNVTRRGMGPYRIAFRDFLSALASRFSNTAGEQALFHDLASTTLDADYTPGDSSITVVDGSGFRQHKTFGNLLIDASGGDSMVLQWGTAGATSITVSTGIGTARVSASVGDTVSEMAYIWDDSIKNFAQVLTSTGTGNNGRWDTLPKSWGYGLPARMVEDFDIAYWSQRHAAASGTHFLRWASTTEQENGLSFILDRMAASGCWPVMRQGKISARAVMDNGYGSFSTLAYSGAPTRHHVRDDAIISLDSWNGWAPDVPIEYRRHNVQIADTNAEGEVTRPTTRSESITGYPSRDLNTVDLYGTRGESYMFNVGSGQAAADAIRDRLAEWYMRTPVTLSLTVGGLRYAGLCPGDWIELTSEVVHGRLPSTAEGYDARRCMVTQVSPDWTRGTVQLGLAVTSDRQDDYA